MADETKAPDAGERTKCPKCGGPTVKDRTISWDDEFARCMRSRVHVDLCPGDRRSGKDRRAEPHGIAQEDTVDYWKRRYLEARRTGYEEGRAERDREWREAIEAERRTFMESEDDGDLEQLFSMYVQGRNGALDALLARLP